MSLYRFPVLRPGGATLLQKAEDFGAFFVGDPSVASARDVTANGAAVDILRNAIEYEYAGVGPNGGRFILSSDIGSGAHALTLDTVNTINGYPCFATSNAGHALQALATTTQSPVPQADIGSLQAKDGPWGDEKPFTIIAALRVMANPANPVSYGGGFLIGKTQMANWVLGISRPPAPDSFWIGGFTGELLPVVISYPDGPPPTGLMIVSLSYDGRARWTMNGVDTSDDDGIDASIPVADPGFGFAPVFSTLGPATARIYWFAYFDNALSLDSVRVIGRALVNRFAAHTRTSVRFWGDSITAGYCNPAMDDIDAWVGDTDYSNGDLAQNDSGKIYVMTATPGTSESSGGPTGTGTDIVDGTCTWSYVGMSHEQAQKPGWPVVATSQLLASGKDLIMDNRGVSGTAMQYIQEQRWRTFVEGPLSVLPRSNVGVISYGIKNVIDNESATTIRDRLIRNINAAKKVGYERFAIGTMIAYAGLTGPQEAVRLAANQLYRNLCSSGGYALIDFAALEDELLGGPNEIQKPDGIHPNASGARTMGNYASGILGTIV